MIPAVRAAGGLAPRQLRAARRPDPAARHPRQHGRLRRDQLQEPGDRRVRHAHRRARVSTSPRRATRSATTRRRPSRQRQRAAVPLLRAEGPGARGRPLHPSRRRATATPSRTGCSACSSWSPRVTATSTRTPARSCRSGGAGRRRSSPAAARRRSARATCCTTRSATRSSSSRPRPWTFARGTTPPGQGPVTTSYRPGSRALNYRSEPFMHRLEVDALDRLKAYAYNSYTFGDPSTPMPRGYLGDPDQDPPRARRLGALPRVPPARRRRPLAREPARDPTYDYAGHRPQQDAGRAVRLAAPRLPVDRPRRVLQPRDRGWRRRRAAGRRRLPAPLPHRRALRLRHVERLARLRHQPARLRAAARPRPAAGPGRLDRPDRPDDAGRHHDHRRQPRRSGSSRSCRRRACRRRRPATPSPSTARCGTGSAATARRDDDNVYYGEPEDTHRRLVRPRRTSDEPWRTGLPEPP